ncbi:MAG: hypothetical protein UY04_C0012G0021 [Parcubacteria group bacterium GW2011_GWA2_47_7]|nr:MAG: hypothetical protein UY04_C0012G0021 [Parcubacteria group bacterium GW2011_GWA2_47_7]
MLGCDVAESGSRVLRLLYSKGLVTRDLVLSWALKGTFAKWVGGKSHLEAYLILPRELSSAILRTKLTKLCDQKLPIFINLKLKVWITLIKFVDKSMVGE